jgi:hypothetical protein
MVAQPASKRAVGCAQAKSRSALNLRARHPVDTDHHCLELAKAWWTGAARPSSPCFMAATLVTGLAIDAIEEIVDAEALGMLLRDRLSRLGKDLPLHLDAITFSMVLHRRYGLSGIVAIVFRHEIVAGRSPIFLRVVLRPIILQIKRLMGHSEA